MSKYLDNKLDKIVGDLAKYVRLYRSALKDEEDINAKEYENAIRVSFEAFNKLQHPRKWQWLMNHFASGIYNHVLDGDFQALMEVYEDMHK